MGKLYAAGTDVRSLASGLEIFAGKVVDLGGNPATELAKLTAEMANAKTETDAVALAMEAGFSDKAAVAYATAVKNGIDITADFSKEIVTAKGRLEEQAKANETLTEKLDILRNQFICVGMDIAEKLLPHLQTLIDWMKDDGNLNKALVGLGVLVGGLFATKVITGIAGLVGAIKGIGAAATAAAGTAAVSGSGVAAAAAGSGLALIIAKLGIIAGIAAAGFTIFFLIKWLSDPMTPEQVAVRDRVFGSGDFTPPQIGTGPVSTSPSDPGLFWRPPSGPGSMVPGAGQASAALGALGRTGAGSGIFYPQGGAPVEPEEPIVPATRRGGGQLFPQPRSGPIPTGADAPMRVKPYARGGWITKPTLALMGEAGPEYVMPKSQMGITVEVNIGTMIGTDKEAERVMVSAITSAVKHNPGIFRPFNDGLQQGF